MKNEHPGFVELLPEELENINGGSVISFLNGLATDTSISLSHRLQYKQLADKLEVYYASITNPFMRLSYTLKQLNQFLIMTPDLF